MKPLVLFLTIWGADAPHDGPMVYVMGGNLTTQACTAGMADLARMADLVGGSVLCEFGLAQLHDSPDVPLTSFPPCRYEDSTNCFWHAGESENGQGVYFITSMVMFCLLTGHANRLILKCDKT